MVQKLHGHKSIDTTIRSYCGLEAKSAVAHYDHLILELRDKAPQPPKRGAQLGRPWKPGIIPRRAARPCKPSCRTGPRLTSSGGRRRPRQRIFWRPLASPPMDRCNAQDCHQRLWPLARLA